MKNYIAMIFGIIAFILFMLPLPSPGDCPEGMHCVTTFVPGGIYFFPWGILSLILAGLIYFYPFDFVFEGCSHSNKQEITDTLEVCLSCQRFIEKEAT